MLMHALALAYPKQQELGAMTKGK